MTNARKKLPIDDLLPSVGNALRANANLILKASPGSGKTTRVPPFLMQNFEGEILVLEPRRVAARMSAMRVTEELGEPIGESIGYQFRFESRIGPKTRVKFLTEGLLIRRLLRDPELKGVSIVVLDEFHERHLHTDVALSFLHHLQQTRRPDLKLVVMSATLDTTALQKFLNTESVLNLEAPLFPIEISYAERPLSRPLAVEIASAVQKALSRSGDILVFLPGQREIRAATETLSNLRRQDLVVMPLHGDLSIQQQVEALTPIEGKRRVILSTNIAETSLTIEGITQVIDSGLHRQARFSQWSGVPILETRNISRASAIQRAGRAGRLGPGACYRLYTQADFQSRLEFELPEIQRAELSVTALELFAFGWNPKQNFPWFEAPREVAWKAALETLQKLNALDERGLTSLGKRMAEFPLSPRLARAALEGEAQSLGVDSLATLAALAEGEVETLDLRESLDRRLSPRSDRVLRILESHLKLSKSTKKVANEVEALSLCLLAGFPDRVAKIRKKANDKVELTLAFGGALTATRTSRIWESKDEYVLVLEAQESKDKSFSTAWAQVLLPLKEEWLLNHSITQVKEELRWNKEARRIEKRSRMNYGELTLWEEKEKLTEKDEAAALEILLKDAAGIRDEDFIRREALFEKLQHVFSTEGLKAELARVMTALQAGPIEGWSIGDSGNDHWLRMGLLGVFSAEDLNERDWLSAWVSKLEWSKQETIKSEIERRAPKTITLGKRKNAPIHYEFEKPPWVESRMQDFFGMKEGPKVLRGRVPLVLHLLAPNYRAVQVTQDLNGFWQRHYPSVRQELKRRYPRHSWPEDPLKPFVDDEKN